jgi:hypothetical protein
MTDTKEPHIKLTAFKNSNVPANAPQYSTKKFKIEKDITIKAGEYDVDVFENTSANGNNYLNILLKDRWVNPNQPTEGSEPDF